MIKLLEEDNELELDLEPLDLKTTFEVLYEDDSFRVLHPLNEQGAMYLFTQGDWGVNSEDNWRVLNYNEFYTIEEKTGKKRSFLFKDGYGDLYAPSGARYSCATWVAKNGTNGLKRWFVTQNFPYITTNLKKKLGAEYLGNTDTYVYPTDDDPGHSARKKSTQITKIKIKDGTTSIKDIGGFKSVKTLIIPEGVKRIGRYACGGLSSLENLYLPDTLQRIGERAFVGSESLKSVFIPKSVTQMGTGIFESFKWYSDYRYNTDDIVDPNTLTIYCEVKEKPSGWDERWNACQYTGSRQSARGYESIYSMYPVVWGASRPTMNIEEDLDIEVAPTPRTQKIRKKDIVVPHGTEDLRSRHLKSYEITDDSNKEVICDILNADYLKDYISYPTQWIVYKYAGNSSIGYMLGVHPSNGDYYCDMENELLPSQRFSFSSEQVDEIESFLNINLREDLDLDITPIPNWRAGQTEFHNKMKQEAKRLGVEITDIKNMYPSRLDCVWINDYFIKINDRWSIHVYSDGDMCIYEANDEDYLHPIYTEEDLEEHDIFTDDDYYELVGYDDDKPYQMSDSHSCYCGFYIEDGYLGGTYYSYELGYDDNYSMAEMPSIEEFVKKIFPKFLEEEELELEMPNEDDNKEEVEVEEDLELEPTNLDSELYPHLLDPQEECLEIINKNKDKKFWFISLSDGDDWNILSGIDELKSDKELGGLKTFEEARDIFLTYDLQSDLEMLIDEYGEDEQCEVHIYLNCLINVSNPDNENEEEWEWEKDEKIAERSLFYDPDNPENNIEEDLDLDLDVAPNNAQIKTLFEDDKWKVELPINYLGIFELSSGTDWGFEEQMYDDINSDDDFDPNDVYKKSSWNNYKTYVFTNKENGDKFIYCPDRWSLPHSNGGYSFSGYGWLFDKDRNIINLTRGGGSTGARILGDWLETLDDIKLMKWACKKWPTGMAKLKLVVKAKESAQSLNYTLTYGSEEYKKIQNSTYTDDIYKIRDFITTIIIPEGTTQIKDDSFYGYSSIESVELPESITYIGHIAFAECKKLKYINIPSKVKEIGYGSFEHCDLQNIILPEGLTKIGDVAFWGNSNCNNVFIPKSVVDIGKGAFWGLPNTVQVYFGYDSLPDLTRIADSDHIGWENNVHLNAKPSDINLEESLNEDLELDIEATEQPFTIDNKLGYLSIDNYKLKKEIMDIVDKHNPNYSIQLIDYNYPIRIFKASNPDGSYWFFIQAYIPNSWRSFKVTRDGFNEILHKLDIDNVETLHTLFEELDIDVRQNKVIDIKDLPQDCKQYIIDNFCGEHPTSYLTNNLDKTWSLYPLTDWGSDKPTKYQISVKSKNPGYGQPIIADIQFEEMCNACGYKVPVIEELDIESSNDNEYSFIQDVIDNYSEYLSDFSRDEIIDLYLEHGDDDDHWMMSITNNEEEMDDDYFGDFKTVLDRFERYLGNNCLEDNDELEFRYYDKENDAWYDIFYMVYHNSDGEIREDLDLEASETNGLPLQTKTLYK